MRASLAGRPQHPLAVHPDSCTFGQFTTCSPQILKKVDPDQNLLTGDAVSYIASLNTAGVKTCIVRTSKKTN